MTTAIDGQTFKLVHDDDGGQHIHDKTFTNCVFDNCTFAIPRDLHSRSTASHLKFIDCVAASSSVGPGLIDEVIIDGLEVRPILLLWSPFLRHVTLRGRIGPLNINSIPTFVNLTAALTASFAEARAAHYQTVDWALDIREGRFEGFSLSGVPASLVRRDPVTQVVVTRMKASSDGWKTVVPSWNSHWASVIDSFLNDKYLADDAELILVAYWDASKKRFQRVVDGLRNLQDIGVAELD
ncbi:MAG TPA: hypothetical protein VHL58_02915 [Thermoanaerobaculia bacterium]|nr:hypothetical protein [Thermoanaerobaculia bacterium]